PALVLLERLFDLPQPPHPRKRPAERREVRLLRRTEVPQPLSQRPALHGAPLEIRLDRRSLATLLRRLGLGRPFAHDRLPIAPVHERSLPIHFRPWRRR